MASTLKQLRNAKAVFDADEKDRETYAARVRKIISRLSYKPGWSFEVETSPFHWGVAVQVAVEVAEIESGRLEKLRGSIVLNPISQDTEEIIVLCIAYKIQSMEIHEFREWLKLDGRHVQEPHPKSESMAGDSTPAGRAL